MMLNFRLFAGLISLESILCLDHFCSIGPDGILLSRDMAVKGWMDQRPNLKTRMASGIEMKPSQIRRA
jgi:hypothetical protein